MQLQTRDGFILTLALGLMLSAAGDVPAATADLPYTPDDTFGTQGVVTDSMVDLSLGDPPLVSGQKILRQSDGSIIVAGMATVQFIGEKNYLMLARYDASGEREVWSSPTDGYTDETHEYIYVKPAFGPDFLNITAIRDVQTDGYGYIHVLVDALEGSPALTTDSLVVTFSKHGAFKGILTNMATPDRNDIGVAVLTDSSGIFIVSSASQDVTVSAYTVNVADGIFDINTTWGTQGRISKKLWKCSIYMDDVGSIPVACKLHAQRALMTGYTPTQILVGGDYVNDQDTVFTQSDLFVMNFLALDGSSPAGYPVTWESPTIEDGLRGMTVRARKRAPALPQNELYVLNAFSRPCKSGFIVGRFNADTGAYINRTWTQGGGSDPDPNVCANVTSLEATDFTLPQDTTGVNRHVAVVGSLFSGEDYTGKDAFVAWVDTQDMHAAVPVQTVTSNGGQYPDDAGFSAATSNYAEGTITATGFIRSYDGDLSSAMTIRLRQEEGVFSDGFE